MNEFSESEFNPAVLSTLPPPQKTYLESILTTYMKSEVPGLYKILSTNSKFIKFIGLVDQLESFKIGQSEKRRETIEARRILDNFLNQIAPELSRERVSVLLYGSMIYGDPKNLDFDLFFVSELESDMTRKSIQQWTEDLNKRWEVAGERAEGHITYISLARIDMHCKAFIDDWLEYIDQWAEDINHDFEVASILFTGLPIFPSGDMSGIMRIKQELTKLMKKNNTLLATAIYCLKSTLRIRKERSKS